MRWLALIAVFVLPIYSIGQSRISCDSTVLAAPHLFKFDSFQPLFVQVLDNYSVRSTDRVLIHNSDTAIIKTSLFYELGSAKYQNLEIRHIQRLNDSATFVLQYDRSTFDGNFRDEQYARDNFTFNVTNRIGRWDAQANLQYKKLKKAYNEGIIYDTLFTDTLVGRQFIPVFNQGAIIQDESALGSLAVLRNMDTKSSLRLGFNIQLEKETYTYTDDFLLDSIASTRALLIDSTASYDGFSEGYEQYALRLEKDLSILRLRIDAGMVHRYYKNYEVTRSVSPYLGYDLGVKGRLSGNQNLVLVMDSAISISAAAKFSWELDSAYLLNFSGNAFLGDRSNFYNRYVSNHYEWSESSSGIGLYNADLSLINKKWNLSLEYKIYGGSNLPIFADTLYQTVNDAAHWISLEKRVRLSKGWFLSGKYSYFTSNNRYYRFPTHIGQGWVMRKGSLFKNKLPCYLKLEYVVSTAFDQHYLSGPTYDLIEGGEVPQYGYFNVYAHGRLGTVDLYLNVYNLSEGLFGYNYFDMPSLPGKDRIISFGARFFFDD